jgi:hypothetical protein
MRNFMNNFEELIHHTGLYRVWVPVREGNRERLVSIWIDPAMRAFEAREKVQTGIATTEHAITSDGDAEAVEEPGGQSSWAMNAGASRWPSERLRVGVTVH